MNTPSERFKAVRKELGLTQNQFAKELNISQVAVYKLEEGQIKSISQEVTKILEEEFGINKIWLHFGEGMMYLDETTNMYSVHNKLEYLSKLCENILAKLGGGDIKPLGEKRGRGRPRKNPIVTESKTSDVKRGRGRPRKNPAVENNSGTKRGPGRPRKNPIVDTTTVKRSVGRPRKNPTDTVATTEAKRGRGRPRKNPIADTTTEKRSVGRPRKNPTDTVAITEAKRGRGRPRKNNVESAATNTIKRSVGRPKKNTSIVAKRETDKTTENKRGRGRPKKK